MTRKKLDENGLLYLLSKLLLLFVRSEPGKGLSQNDLTDELKAQIMAQFSGSWNDLTDRPVNVSTWVNDAEYQTYQQVTAAIAAALAASGFQTAAQVEAAIDQALSQMGDIFIVVDVRPAPVNALPNRIYLVPGDAGLEQWILVNGAWERVGAVEISLDGYFNETNLVPITNAEIDAMIASLI